MPEKLKHKFKPTNIEFLLKLFIMNYETSALCLPSVINFYNVLTIIDVINLTSVRTNSTN